MTGTEARARVVEVARTWIGTPFHHTAGVKGVGVDCAHLLARVYEEAGVIPRPVIENYSAQWFLHRDEERFIGYVKGCGGREIPEEQARQGDCVLYKLGRCFAHGAIIVAWPGEIIHAYAACGHVTSYGGRDGELTGKPVKFYSLFPEGPA